MNYDEIITTPYTVLESLSESEIYDIVSTLIEHYRKTGFPYFEIDDNKIKKECLSLSKSDSSKIELPNNELQQGMLGLATCNMFHQEMYAVNCKNAKSPMDIFLDDDLFRVALTKRIKYNDRNINPSCVRRTLSAFGGQAASNFRPSIARWVYQKYAPIGGSVLDPCMGYGGRLMGAFCSQLGRYVGVDPNKVSVVGNIDLYNHLIDVCPDRADFELATSALPFEDFATTEKFDLVFTSPPYFNVEKYSKDETQSYVRYTTYEKWMEGFLTPLINHSFDYLKPNGYLVLNVGKPIDEDTYKIGTSVFGKEPETYYMRLSKFLGQGNKKDVSHKVEPIFVWKKTT